MVLAVFQMVVHRETAWEENVASFFPCFTPRAHFGQPCNVTGAVRCF